jgi:hypothetical protein
MFQDMRELERLVVELTKTGRMREIEDAEGRIVPSEKALQRAAKRHPNASDAERWRFAQAQTLLEFAKQCKTEMN